MIVESDKSEEKPWTWETKPTSLNPTPKKTATPTTSASSTPTSSVSATALAPSRSVTSIGPSPTHFLLSSTPNSSPSRPSSPTATPRLTAPSAAKSTSSPLSLLPHCHSAHLRSPPPPHNPKRLLL
ncbi:hypothetical protein S245_004855 [Arachis hypogaea]